MPVPETQRPKCEHAACNEVDRYPLQILGREFRLIYEDCSTEPALITGFVNDWLEDKRLASFRIEIPDESTLNAAICIHVYGDLRREMEARITDSRLTDTIVLRVPAMQTFAPAQQY